jgi:hypothetical protein
MNVDVRPERMMGLAVTPAAMLLAPGQSRARGLPERRTGRQAARPGNGCGRLFSAGADAPLHREAK